MTSPTSSSLESARQELIRLLIARLLTLSSKKIRVKTGSASGGGKISSLGDFKVFFSVSFKGWQLLNLT
jgi:hypothetical protein